MEPVKHTQGPWKFCFGFTPESVEPMYVKPSLDSISGWTSKSISIGDRNGDILAEVKAYTTSGFIQDFNQWEANARLIVAAPELLAAVQLAINIKDLWAPVNIECIEHEGEAQALAEMERVLTEALKKATTL